ncbi:hypothetical protein CEXT_792191 [Caerostris extrusa]|uniref:Class II Histidinyl-tRNA synthetase (HisRS)-like catalytic core domain-containing protein n=1 Tax=Caerostris extrusa TaxID=172846 RepID=A0AAV4PG16_CAEEX|nr:hypothetical protein CEXT_792191 [Caerostris extrusa]
MYSDVKNIQSEIFEIAGEQKDKRISMAMLMKEQNNLNISDASLSKLRPFIEFEEVVDRVDNIFHPVTQKKGEISHLAKNSIKELRNIVSLTKALGVKIPILICPGLAHNISLFSGMFFQCIFSPKPSKKKNLFNILAAGGRYDKLIQTFKLKSLESGKTLNQSAVGASIAIESIVAAENDFNESLKLGIADFLIHSEGAGMADEKATLLKEVLDLGIRATVLYDKNMTLDDAADFCRNHGVQHILVLRKEDPAIIKVRFVDKEKVSEKRIYRSELKEQLPKICLKILPESKVDNNRNSSYSNTLLFNVRFLASDKNHANKKREPNIRSQVITALQTTPSRIWELIPLDLKMDVINKIISFCDVSANEECIRRSFDEGIIPGFPNKFRKYLSQLCEEMCDIRAKTPNCAIILYSLIDSNFRILI